MKKLALIAVLGVFAFSAVSASAGTVGIRSIGVDAGWVSPQDIDGTWSVGLTMDIGLPVTNLYIQPFTSYWNRSESEGGVEASLSDIQFGGNVKYVIATAMPNIQPFIGAGISAHMLKAELSGGTPFDGSVTDTQFGYQLGGGLQVGATDRMNIVGQGWYGLVEDFNQWTVRGGVAFTL
jgi:hypothetical protein